MVHRSVYRRGMKPLAGLTDAELSAELERTHGAYAEYVRDVGENPSHAGRDLDGDARRHLDVQEEVNRRSSDGPSPDGQPSDDPPAVPGDDAADDGTDMDLADRLDPSDVEPYA